MSLEIYVGNYPSSFTSADILDLFRDFQGIKLRSFIRKDKKSFCFILCLDKKQVVDIVTSMNGIDVCGRNLIVRSSDKELQSVTTDLMVKDGFGEHATSANNKHSVTLEKKINCGINYKPISNDGVSEFPDGVRFNNPRLHFSQTATKNVYDCQKQEDSRQSAFNAANQLEKKDKNESQGNFSSHGTKERPTSAQAYYKHKAKLLNSPDQQSSSYNYKHPNEKSYNSDSKDLVNKESRIHNHIARDCNNDLQLVDLSTPLYSEKSAKKSLFNQDSGNSYLQSNSDKSDSRPHYLPNSGIHRFSPGNYTKGDQNVTDCKTSMNSSSNEKNVDFKTSSTSCYREGSENRIKNSRDYSIGHLNSDCTNVKRMDKADSFSYCHQVSEIHGQNGINFNKGHLVDDYMPQSHYQDSGIHTQNASYYNQDLVHESRIHSRSSRYCKSNLQLVDDHKLPYPKESATKSLFNQDSVDSYLQSNSGKADSTSHCVPNSGIHDCTNVKNMDKADSSAYCHQVSGIHGQNGINFNKGHVMDDDMMQSHYQDSGIHSQNTSYYNKDQVNDYRQPRQSCIERDSGIRGQNTNNYANDHYEDDYSQASFDDDFSGNAGPTDLSDDLVPKEDLFYVSVANFPLYTTINDLYDLFEDFDPYDIVMICNKPRLDKKPTEAIISFKTQNLATDAIINFDNTSYFGRGLVVTDATDISIVPTLLCMGLSDA